MNKYTATVIKTGNSYALRVPKGYIEATELELGNKVILPLVQKEHRENHTALHEMWTELQALNPLSDITDPVAWQQEIRRDRSLIPRDTK